MTTEVQATGGGGETTSAAAPTNVDGASLAAAREAMGQAEAPPAVEAAAEVAPPAPAAAAPPPPEALTELEQLRAEIRGKAQEQKLREKLDGDYKTKLDAAIAQQRKSLAEEARAAVVAEYREKMRLSPAETITEFGVDGIGLVTELAERAGPAGKQHAEMVRLRAELEAMKASITKEADSRLAALEKARADDIARQQQAQAEASTRQLVTLVTEKTPAALAYYGGEAKLVERAQAIADEYCAAKEVRTCPYSVLVQELESEARKGVADRLKSLDAERTELSKLLQQPAGIAAQPSESNGRNTGPRTLSAQGASERRASPKPQADMTPAELDQAMIEAASAIIGPKKTARMA